MSIAEGQPAPDFTLTSTDGSLVTLSSLKGQNVVLYFYPKDDTSGCTVEACSFRDNIATVQSHGALLFGLSPDSIKKHAKFTQPEGLEISIAW